MVLRTGASARALSPLLSIVLAFNGIGVIPYLSHVFGADPEDTRPLRIARRMARGYYRHNPENELMRWISTVVAAAILLFLLYAVLAFLVDGYWGGNIWPHSMEPESWSPPDSWSEWRDIVIVFGGLWFALAGLLLVALLGALVYVAFTVRTVLKENVAPAVDSAKATLDNVRGTTEFAGQTVVSPIIRTYSIIRGVRSGIGAVGSIGDRIKGNRGRGKKGKKK